MKTFVVENFGYLVFCVILFGGVFLITERFSNLQENSNYSISINK